MPNAGTDQSHSLFLSPLCAPLLQTWSVGKTAAVFMRVPAVAAVAVPSSAPAQPPRGLGAERAHLGDGAAGAMSRPGSVLPSENGASRPPRGGRRAEPRLRSVLPHTGPGNSRTPRTPKEQGRLINGACGPAAARPEPPGAAPAGPSPGEGKAKPGPTPRAGKPGKPLESPGVKGTGSE